jgi:large subunit ribosomal protein L32e
MSEIQRLLKVRMRQKSRKPEFKRYCWNKKLRLREKSWRRPRGLHSKLRRRYGGKEAGRRIVTVGYGTPKVVRGLHPSGYEEVLVYNPKDLEKVDPSKQVARIASSVGMKKRLAIEGRAEELGIRILNPTG